MTAWLAAIDWATPWAGLLALAPLVLAWLAKRREGVLARWADPHLLPWALSEGADKRPGRGLRHLDWPAWLLLALAAAGPRLALDDLPGQTGPARHALDLVAVVDISASMAAGDIAPARLGRARLKLADLAARLKGERVGLVVYAGRAGLLLPLSADRALLDRAVGRIGTDLIDKPGTNPVDALRLAADTLAGSKARAVLLMTDGEAGDLAEPAIQPLLKGGIPLYVLEVASPAGTPIPDTNGGFVEQDGAQVVSRPDSAAWRRAAAATGGGFAEVTDGDGDLGRLYDGGIARLPGTPVPTERARAWRPLFAYPLAAALALFMLARWPSALAVVLLFALLPSPARAASDPVYLGQMQAGVAAWKRHDYGAAAERFGRALLMARSVGERADALYDLGGAHYGLANWQAAAEAWRAVLAIRPGDARATANLAQAEAQLARQGRPIHACKRRGHHGSAAEGELIPELSLEATMDIAKAGPMGPLAERLDVIGDARLASAASASGSNAVDDRLARSGLRKMELIGDDPRPVLRGLLKQDTPPDAKPLELAPW